MRVSVIFYFNDNATQEDIKIIDDCFNIKNFKSLKHGYYLGDIGHNFVDIVVILSDLNKKVNLRKITSDIEYLRIDEIASFSPFIIHLNS